MGHSPQDPDYQAETQKQKDIKRFKSRARVKDTIIAIMAAENMERVRNGVWTSADLIGLTQDSELKDILDDVNSLSFEIAHSKIDALTNPLLTEDIKGSWKQLLSENFFL